MKDKENHSDDQHDVEVVESGFLNCQDDALPIGEPGMPLDKTRISEYLRASWRSPGKSPIERVTVRDVFECMGGHGQRLPPRFRSNCEAVLEEMGAWKVQKDVWELGRLSGEGDFALCLPIAATAVVAGLNGFTVRVASVLSEDMWMETKLGEGPRGRMYVSRCEITCRSSELDSCWGLQNFRSFLVEPSNRRFLAHIRLGRLYGVTDELWELARRFMRCSNAHALIDPLLRGNNCRSPRWTCDRERIRAAAIGGYFEDDGLEYQHAIEHTWSVITTPQHWRSICHVADELLKQRRLSGRLLTRLLPKGETEEGGLEREIWSAYLAASS